MVQKMMTTSQNPANTSSCFDSGNAIWPSGRGRRSEVVGGDPAPSNHPPPCLCLSMLRRQSEGSWSRAVDGFKMAPRGGRLFFFFSSACFISKYKYASPSIHHSFISRSPPFSPPSPLFNPPFAIVFFPFIDCDFRPHFLFFPLISAHSPPPLFVSVPRDFLPLQPAPSLLPNP